MSTTQHGELAYEAINKFIVKYRLFGSYANKVSLLTKIRLNINPTLEVPMQNTYLRTREDTSTIIKMKSGRVKTSLEKRK
jgi:hypothetical protein